MGLLTVLGRRRAASGPTPVVLDTSTMGIVFRWDATNGATVGTLNSEGTTSATTTPNGTAAKTFTASGAFQLDGDVTSVISGSRVYILAVAKLPTGDGGDVFTAGQRSYFGATDAGVLTMRVGGTTRNANNGGDAINTWQAFIADFNGASSQVTYDGATYTLDGSLGSPAFALTDALGARNIAVSLAEVIVCTAPSNFAEYAAYQYGVGNG